MWAEPLGGDRYRLQNVPFYAYGLSFDDVVSARQIGGQLFVQDVVERGGHSTYRIFLSQDVKRGGAVFKRPGDHYKKSVSRTSRQMIASWRSTYPITLTYIERTSFCSEAKK
jgi:hypothetical protein